MKNKEVLKLRRKICKGFRLMNNNLRDDYLWRWHRVENLINRFDITLLKVVMIGKGQWHDMCSIRL